MPTEEPRPDTSTATEIEAFAAELRALRERPGSPSFRELARLTHFSASTLAEATAGRRLPTEPVVRAFAQGCGSDPEVWVERLRRAGQPVTSPAPAPPPTTDDAGADPAHAGRRRFGRVPRWTAEVAGAAVFLAAGFAMAGTAASGRTSDISAPPAAVQPAALQATAPQATALPPDAVQPATDGSDPIKAGCVLDAQLIDKSVLRQGNAEVGALELKFSSRCAAGWARVYLYPAGVEAHLTEALSTVAVTAADGTSTAYTARLDRQVPDFTDVISPNRHGGCLKATATLVTPGRPTLRASITCDALGAVPAATRSGS